MEMEQENILQNHGGGLSEAEPVSQEERKIVFEFNELLEESKILFNGLR